MPQLQRPATRLLRTVGNKEWADKSHHDETGKRSPSSSLSPVPADLPEEENIFHSPEASDAEDDENVQSSNNHPPTVPNNALRKPIQGKSTTQNIHGTARRKIQDVGSAANSDKFKLPSTASKRKATQEPEVDEEDSTVSWMGSSQTKRTTYGSQRSQTYSKKAQPQKKLKEAKKVEKHASPKAARFKTVANKDGFNINADSSSQPEAASVFKKREITLKGLSATPNSSHPLDSSPLSMASSPPDDEPEILDISSASCPLCGVEVDREYKLDWELENCKGRRMNMKMQERFCRAHKTRNAKQAYEARKYPEVDWSALPKRFKKHQKHIQAILEGKASSSYRDDLEKKVREGTTRTAMHSLEAGTSAGAQVGYYGSRGQKMMMEFILNTFAEKMRRLTGTDKLVAAKGIAGGVSGYAQSVLVPELALTLIMEDCNVDSEEAKRIITESAEIGEALHEEEEERIPRTADSPEPEYGADDTNAKRAMERLVVLDD